ncbi:hypothetical protein Tco_0643462 [Tanacetum coccineum]
MYLTASRPDIIFAICACVRFQVTPKVSHLHAVKRIFRYLKGQPKLGLWYPKDSPFDLEAYTDSDYAGASLDRKSTVGVLVYAARHSLTAVRHKLMLLGITSYSKFAETHNMVAFLEKSTESKGFEQIIDFLNASYIRYALTINPTVYVSCVDQFWSTGVVKKNNGESEIHALIDGKKIIVSEATIRSVL